MFNSETIILYALDIWRYCSGPFSLFNPYSDAHPFKLKIISRWYVHDAYYCAPDTILGDTQSYVHSARTLRLWTASRLIRDRANQLEQDAFQFWGVALKSTEEEPTNTLVLDWKWFVIVSHMLSGNPPSMFATSLA
jgi:hypothetical protein